MTENRRLVRELAAEAVRKGQPLDWFERLYELASGDPSSILWADHE